MADYQVGQQLYFVPAHKPSHARLIEIEKVGRKWLTAGRFKIDRETLEVDGGFYSSPGRCWLSQGDYEAAYRLALAWEQFKLHLQNIPRPTGLTLDKIREARRVLGLESEEQ